MPYQPFSMGNALAQAEGIVGQRNRNALAQQQLDPNSTANQLRRAQIEKLQREAQNPGGSTTYGKKVEYAMDADGKTLRGFAIGDDGSAKELRLPPGMTWADTYSAKDMGSFMALFGRRTGYQGGPSTDTPSPDMSDIPSATLPEQPQAQGLGGVMKTIPPEQTPSHKREVETAILDAQLGVGGGTSKADVAEAEAEARKVGMHKGDLKANKTKTDFKMASLQEKTSTLDGLITRAGSMANALTVGWGGDLTKSTAGTPAHDLYLVLSTIKANAGFDAITAMKEAGGTLGQVTEKEMPLLQAKYSALEQSASKPEFLKNLAEFNRQQKRTTDLMAAAYRADYGKPFNMKEFEALGGGGVKKPDFITDEEWGNLTDEQRNQLAD